MWSLPWFVPALGGSPAPTSTADADPPCEIGNWLYRERPGPLEPLPGPGGTSAFLSRDEVAATLNVGTGSYVHSAMVHVLLPGDGPCPVTVATVLLPGAQIRHSDPTARYPDPSLTPEDLARLSWTRGAMGTFTVTPRGFRSGDTEWRWFGQTFAAVPASPDARLSVVPSDDAAWFYVRNDGTTPVDLHGITLRDSGGGVSVALRRPPGGSRLAPGATARVGPTEPGAPPVGALVDFLPFDCPSSFDLLAGDRVVASKR